MAASVSTIGYGGTLEYSTDDGSTWTTVAEFKSGTIPTDEIEKVERTHMSSPDRTREYTDGLKTPNDTEFTFNFNSSDYSNLRTLQENRTEALWKHTLATEDSTTSGAEFQYYGFVTLGAAETTVEGITEVSATILRTKSIESFTAAS